MAVTNVSGSTVRTNNSTILTTGTTATNAKLLSQITVNSASVGERNYPGKTNGTFTAFKSDAVSITSITEDTGYCLVTKSSHGLSVGDAVDIGGTNVVGYNRVHIITEVPTANTFVTNVVYTANTSTHGSYKTTARLIDTQTNPVMAKGLPNNVAGTASNELLNGTPGAQSYYFNQTTRRINITGWNAITGAATKGSNAGAVSTYINPVDGTDAVNSEVFASSFYPAAVTFRYGGPEPTTTDYVD